MFLRDFTKITINFQKPGLSLCKYRDFANKHKLVHEICAVSQRKSQEGQSKNCTLSINILQKVVSLVQCYRPENRFCVNLQKDSHYFYVQTLVSVILWCTNIV